METFSSLFGWIFEKISLFAFGWIYNIFMRWRKPQLQILDASYTDDWTLYFGNVIKNDNRTIAFNQLPGQDYIYGDIESTLIVSEVFCSAFKNTPKYKRFLNGADRLENVAISVGGPKWNKITETLIGALGSPARYEEGKRATFLTRNNLPIELEYKEEKNNSAAQVTDVGIILIGKSKALQKDKRIKAKSVCVVTGYSVYGVRLAAEYLKEMASDKAEFKDTIKYSKICIVIPGKVKIGNNGEVTDWQFGKIDKIYENEFLSPDLYSY